MCEHRKSGSMWLFGWTEMSGRYMVHARTFQSGGVWVQNTRILWGLPLGRNHPIWPSHWWRRTFLKVHQHLPKAEARSQWLAWLVCGRRGGATAVCQNLWATREGETWPWQHQEKSRTEIPRQIVVEQVRLNTSTNWFCFIFKITYILQLLGKIRPTPATPPQHICEIADGVDEPVSQPNQNGHRFSHH